MSRRTATERSIQRSTDAYLHGEVCERLIADESFSYLKVNHFGVIEDLSVVAGSPGVHDSARAHPGLV